MGAVEPEGGALGFLAIGFYAFASIGWWRRRRQLKAELAEMH